MNARLLVAGLAAASVLAGGCSDGSSDGKGKGVAQLQPTGGKPSSKAASPPSRAQVKAQALAYAKCMRSHGVPRFPDPNGDGGIAINGDEVQQDSAQFKAADQTCKPLLGPPPPNGGEDPQDRAAGLKYAACMRSHGVAKFPDPNAGGGINLDADKIGMDPNGAVFKAADKACQHFMRDGKRGPVNNQSG